MYFGFRPFAALALLWVFTPGHAFLLPRKPVVNRVASVRSRSSPGEADCARAGRGASRRVGSQVAAKKGLDRRRWLHACPLGLLTALASTNLGDASSSWAAEPAAERRMEGGTPAPLVDLPLRRLKLPKGSVGRDYVLVPIDFPGEAGTQEFMLDSGLTLEMVTPALASRLGLKRSGRATGAAVGATRQYEVVALEGASVAGVPLPLNLKLHATVTDFPQEHLDPTHDVSGMLGLEFMEAFDVDLDFPKQRLRLWRRGDGAAKARLDPKLVEVPAALLPGGVLGVRVAGAAQKQPFLGIVDCGASFSTLSPGAASLAGVEASSPKAGSQTRLVGVGIDGRPLPLPLADKPAALRLVGNPGASSRGGGPGGAASAFPVLAALPEVRCAVSQLPVFYEVLGAEAGGVAALIGLDVLAQGRLLFAAPSGDGGRARSIFWG
mmetsp:Transcript_48001/g.108993  ORF Transcript_48001/g.108993 Transcript_48001/m.108993 type:complete len:437 (+) Transcript_48001:98-1408(+)